MKSLGSHFKRKREEKGYGLDEVTEATNIPSRYLEAIEAHDFSEFPADVYAKGFIRSYANFLDLDAQALVMEYSLNFEDKNSETTNSESAGGILYWTTAVVLSLVVVGLLLFRFAFVPAEPPDLARRTSSGNLASKSMIQTAEDSFDLKQHIETLRLKVVASEETWVSAIFDGTRKKEFMFMPGDEMSWEATDTIRLRVGNAGGLKLFHHGKRLPSLGKSGEVVDRVITLTDGKLKIKPPG